jgi:hypothetical protein
MGISVSMNCPKCGGALSVDEGSKTTTCPYCSLLLEIQGDDGVKKIMLTNNLDKDKAIARVKGWWHEGFKARDLKNKGEITECYPIYVPFWSLKARVAGWVCGYNVVHENKTTKKVPKEVMINRDMDWNEVACDPGDIGIQHLHNLDGKAVLHNEGSIPTFEVTSSNTDALARGIESIRNSAIGMSGVSNKTFQKVHVFPEDTGLIFYPIWITRYKYQERMYFATVDGITGKVLSGRAPGDYMWRSLVMTGGMAVGGFGSCFALWVAGTLGSSSSNSLGGGLIVAAICLAAAYGCWRFYRYGAEVTTGEFKTDHKPGGMPAGLEKMMPPESAEVVKAIMGGR